MEEVRGQRRKKKIPWGTILALVGKSGKLVKVAKAIKLMKFVKPFLTLFTMFLSALAYSVDHGIWFGVGFVLLLFVHEMGHVIAIRMKGHPWKAPIFIPMLGAVVFAPPFKDADEEAFIGYGGPLLGGLSALAMFVLWLTLPEPHELIILLAYVATFVNLFNLLPVRPLDGGRVLHSMGGWVRWIGVGILFLLSLWIKQPSILLIWILVLSDFDSIDTRLRFYAASACFISMVSLMLLGYSDQKFWVDVLDVILASIFVWTLSWQMKKDEERRQRNQSMSPMTEEPKVVVPMAIQMKWFSLYIVLAAGLITLMFLQAPYLPHTVKEETQEDGVATESGSPLTGEESTGTIETLWDPEGK